MLAQGVAAEQLTLIVSALNDQLTQRIIELELARHDLSGIDWCWMVFGSEGRFEQTLSTDQDNGIVFGAAGAPDAARERLLPFAKAVNATLDACGFPLCKGNIMASNPELCLSLAEWIARFDDWVRNSDPQALLNAAIFFDFRALHGYEAMIETLREKLVAMTEGNERFLHMMARNALQVRPPLGRFRDFTVDNGGDFPGTIDLKMSGARLFVDAARVMGLATGVANTNTAQRLRHAGHRLRMSEDEILSAIDSFFFIQMLRLRQQQADPGGAGGRNRIDPDTLNQIDRRILKEAFRHARRLQSRLELDYRL
jgi:CBS domain-containing protein